MFEHLRGRLVAARRITGIALACTLVVGAYGARASEAQAAHVDGNGWPPVNATLWSGDLGQRGELFAYRYTTCGHFDCVTADAGGELAFPDAPLRLGAGSHEARALVRTTKHRPAIIIRHIDSDGQLIERIDRQRAEPTSAPRRWQLEFSTPELPPDAYLNILARWRSPSGGRDHASWGFHLAE